jgi:hypothetical protein
MEENLKQHWEHIYQTKQPNEVSWTEEVPTASIYRGLKYLHQLFLLNLLYVDEDCILQKAQ